ncbi:MAG TPA: hypothetical protein VKA67_04965, partial [Verrucomicrobiae bacterium]|nr:hypothetical protein [Verrucomicrobiae bacterium]
PAAVLTIAAPDNSPWLGWVMTTSIICGCVYFPMAFSAVALFDTVTAVNPLLVIPSILKIPWEYLTTVALFGLMLLIRWVGKTFVVALVPIPVLPNAFFSFISLYLLTVEMRILGLLYWTKKAELGWFRC